MLGGDPEEVESGEVLVEEATVGAVNCEVGGVVGSGGGKAFVDVILGDGIAKLDGGAVGGGAGDEEGERAGIAEAVGGEAVGEGGAVPGGLGETGGEEGGRRRCRRRRRRRSWGGSRSWRW